MSRLSLTPTLLPDAFQSMFSQMVNPWRREESMLDAMFKPSLHLMDSAFSRSFNDMVHSFSNSLRMRESMLAGMDVNVEVVERNGAYKVRADLPGMKKEDISVRIDGNIINIEAKTQDAIETKDSDGKVLYNERYRGAVSRTVLLDQDLDETKATGKYLDGVLTLELPKKASTHKAEAKPIAIE